MTLLEYLHKHSGSLGERIALDPKPISRSLRISMNQFAENSASLAAHGFAGMRDFRPNTKDVPSSKCSAIWLTKKGDDYLRGLSAVSETPTQMTSNAIPKVLADYLDSAEGSFLGRVMDYPSLLDMMRDIGSSSRSDEVILQSVVLKEKEVVMSDTALALNRLVAAFKEAFPHRQTLHIFINSSIFRPGWPGE